MSGPMRIRAILKDGVADVRVLISHPMETGQRKDSAGNTIPAHYITEVKALHNDKVVMSAIWGPAVSQNPFLQFSFKGAKAGDTVTVSWKDNKGGSQSESVTLS
jgi:sulfur-oxidizing protein SoxZ